MSNALGSQYNITTVDFANLTLYESVKVASQSRIMVGVHGAGLIWSGFLKSDRHAGLLEMFGGDRGPANRHYHNIASLADIHYRSMSLKGSLRWDKKTVNTIVGKIKSIDFNQEPGSQEPRVG